MASKIGDKLEVSGGFEPGFDATRVGMSDPMGFRSNAGACAILITDEDADISPQIPTTKAQALAALGSRNAIFLGIVGTDGTSEDDYGPNPGSLSAATGGQVFSITDFRRNPEPVLTAIIDKCIKRIATPDLELSKTDGRETARAGDELTYTLTVKNDSTGIASGIALTDALPEGATFVGASDGGTESGGKVTWPAFDLAAGQTATRTVTVKVDATRPVGSQLVNTATVADDGANGPDPTPANNAAKDTDTIDAPANTAPSAQDLEVVTDEGTAAAVTLKATDAEGDDLGYSVVAEPQHGKLSGTAPHLTYTPDAGYSGPDSFTYQANDGTADSNLAKVSITVNPVNGAPDAVDDAAATDEDTELTVTAEKGVLANDKDADGDALSATVVREPEHGVLTLNGNGSFSYRPDPDFNGEDSFTYRVGDGNGGTDTATVTIKVNPVNDPPTADAGGPYEVNEGDSVEVHGSGTDVEGDPLTYAWDLDDDGSFETPGQNPDFSAANLQGPSSYRIWVRVTDAGGASATDEATVNVKNTVKDTTAPMVVCDEPDGLWHNDNVGIDCEVSDEGAGLADPADASFTLFTSVPEGEENANAQTNSREVCDKAGNCVTAGPIAGNKVDRKAPEVSIAKPFDNAEYGLDRAIKADYACADGGSGTKSCAGPVASGANIATALLGSKSFTVTAIDQVGNESSKTVVYKVVNDAFTLTIDSETIAKGIAPNKFSGRDVNADTAAIGARTQLRYFAANVGKEITLYSGQVGDEGMFAPKTIPSSWATAGPTTSGLLNYVKAGPGLGAPNAIGDREALLDKIPDVTPLRATGLKQLVGQRVYAVVYESDVMVNYAPLSASLKGKNLGVVAFEVVEVKKRTGASSSTLPQVRVRILNASKFGEGLTRLHTQAPVPSSASSPMDTTP